MSQSTRLPPNQASGCRCIAPLGHSATAFGPCLRLPMHLPRRVCRWWSRRCTDLRPIGTPTLHGVASLHMVILAIPANRHPRLSPHCLSWHGSPRPCMVFVTLPGSSSPISSTAAALPQATCTASSGRCMSHRLLLRQSRRSADPSGSPPVPPPSSSSSSTTSSPAFVFIPDYIVYSNNHGLHRHISLYAALRTATVTEASSASPSDTGARFMIVPTLERPVLATPKHS
jgi:hypothetical protein